MDTEIMGLFVLPENNTSEETIAAALANLELWKCNKDKDYLITDFAIPLLQRALNNATQKNNNNKKREANNVGHSGE